MNVCFLKHVQGKDDVMVANMIVNTNGVLQSKGKKAAHIINMSY